MAPESLPGSRAPGKSPSSAGWSSRSRTRSAAATEACRSLRSSAVSRIGPENLREYSTKEDSAPRDSPPPKYSRAPKTLTAARERLLMKLTEGPRAVLAQSAL